MLKPSVGNIAISIVVVIVVHFIAKFFVCAPGPCPANYIYNNYPVYALIFLIVYILYNIFRK